MAVDNGRRIIDQDTSMVIYPEDNIIIDSTTNGTRKISYEALCAAVAETLGIAAIRQTANGAMQKTVYDADADGIVDNAEALQGHGADYFAKASDLTPITSAISGKMDKSVYDADGDGIVDNAEKVNGHTVHSDVPAQAVFTDTVYDDTGIKGDIGDLDNLQTSDKTSLVAAVNVAHSEAVAAAKTATDLGLSVKDGMLQVTYE
jgi:hypothetical protein